jgi:hypothetical protein
MSACSRCGAQFSCGMVDGDTREPCWCTGLPALPADALIAPAEGTEMQNCLCPTCLALKIASLRSAIE